MLSSSSSTRDLLAELNKIVNGAEIASCTALKRRNLPKYKRSPLGLSELMPTLNEKRDDYLNDKMNDNLDDKKDKDDHVNTNDNPDNLVITDDNHHNPTAPAVNEKKYKKFNSELVIHCKKLLQITAYPSVAQITSLIHQIIQSNPTTATTNDLQEIKSLVLQWFRKRREYLAAKVYSVCDDLMEGAWDAACLVAASRGIYSLSYDEIMESLIADEILMGSVLRAAKLPIKNEANGLNFVRRKVRDYFTKLCTHK